MIGRQAFAILWAQWRSIANYNGRSLRSRIPFTLIFALLWYGMWAFVAFAVMRVAADDNDFDLLQRAAAGSMLLIFIYWQIVPVIMVSAGISLDLNRLIVYPIPHSQLFGIEVVLRISIALEMLLIVLGTMAGLLMNTRVPVWSPFALIPFILLNLFLSTAIRDLLGRLLARKGFREVMIFGLVLLAALPQLFLVSGPPKSLRALLKPDFGVFTPWGATASLMLGEFSIAAMLSLAGWTVLTYMLGRSQFERSLRFDAAAARSTDRVAGTDLKLLERALRLPSLLFKDPLAALVEKEVRCLSRSARFRLLFMMGFSFGLIIWLPLAMRADADSLFRTNYLTIVSAYALMLLGEVCFWNTFGMDRSAAQTYFVTPLKLSTVLIAKNIAATFFIFLEITLIALFCSILRMPITIETFSEAMGVTAVLTVFMLAMGNMISTRYPKAVDPGQSWRSGSIGRVQAYLLFLYPVASAPVMLAYAARYAFDSEMAFYAMLLLDIVIGIVVYTIALQSSIETAEDHKENIILALSSGQGPVGS